MFFLPTEFSSETAFKFVDDMIGFFECPYRFNSYFSREEVLPIKSRLDEDVIDINSWVHKAADLPGMITLYEHLCWVIAVRSRETGRDITFNHEVRFFEPFVQALIKKDVICDMLLYGLIAVTDMRNDVNVGSLLYTAVKKWAELGENEAFGRMVGIGIGHGGWTSAGREFYLELNDDFVGMMRNKNVQETLLETLFEEAYSEDHEHLSEWLEEFSKVWAAAYLGINYYDTKHNSGSEEAKFYPKEFLILAKYFQKRLEKKQSKTIVPMPLRSSLTWGQLKRPECSMHSLESPAIIVDKISGEFCSTFIWLENREYLLLASHKEIFIYDIKLMTLKSNFNIPLLKAYSWNMRIFPIVSITQYIGSENRNTTYKIMFSEESRQSYYLTLLDKSGIQTNESPLYSNTSHCGCFLIRWVHMSEKNDIGTTIEIADVSVINLTSQKVVWSTELAPNLTVLALEYLASSRTVFGLLKEPENAHVGVIRLVQWDLKGNIIHSQKLESVLSANMVVDEVSGIIYCCDPFNLKAFSLDTLVPFWSLSSPATLFGDSVWFDFKTFKLLPHSKDILIFSNSDSGTLLRYSSQGKLVSRITPIHPCYQGKGGFGCAMSVSDKEDMVAISIDIINEDVGTVIIKMPEVDANN